MMENKKKSPSWLTITIWFILFWPVGVYLIWKKLATDKSAAMKNSKVLKVIGYLFIFCAVVMLMTVFDDGTDVGSSLGGMMFYLIGGILILWGAKKIRESGEKYKKYIDVVINQQQHTIDNIAAQVGTSYDNAVKELQKMIDKGYFMNAHIDYASHEIIFENRSTINQFDNSNNSKMEAVASTIKVVRCPNCGGNNTIIVGHTNECDFCGSPIE
jgi:hypothetical protein